MDSNIYNVNETFLVIFLFPSPYENDSFVAISSNTSVNERGVVSYSPLEMRDLVLDTFRISLTPFASSVFLWIMERDRPCTWNAVYIFRTVLVGKGCKRNVCAEKTDSSISELSTSEECDDPNRDSHAKW